MSALSPELIILSEAERVRNNIISDPLLQRYMTHIGGGESVRNTEPWHAQGERQLAIVTLLSIITGEVPSPNPDVPFFHNARVVSTLAIELMNAEVVLWTNDTEKIAFGLELPQHTIHKDVLPFPNFFMSHETCLVASDSRSTSNWMWILDMKEEGIMVMHDVVCDGRLELGGFTFKPGSVWPDDYKQSGVGMVLRYCAFLNSPYIETERRYLPRHIHRERKHSNHATDNDYTILLRRAQPQGGHRDDSSGRHLHHQFWVKSHYRKQWYASEKAHKVIIIPQFLKGPSDAPFINKTYVARR